MDALVSVRALGRRSGEAGVLLALFAVVLNVSGPSDAPSWLVAVVWFQLGAFVSLAEVLWVRPFERELRRRIRAR